MIKFAKLGENRYISASKFSLIKNQDGYHILINSKLPRWNYVFSSVQCAETYLNKHNYTKITASNVPISADDFEFIVDMYDFTCTGRNKWSNKNATLDFNVKDKDDIEITITPNKSSSKSQTFNDAADLVSYLDDISSCTAIKCASARDITRNLVRVKSSNLWAYAINIKDRHDKEGDVYIQFKNRNGGPGDIYVYWGVPINVWRRLISSTSKGHSFWKLIRNNYRYSKLTGDKRGKLRNAVN